MLQKAKGFWYIFINFEAIHTNLHIEYAVLVLFCDFHISVYSVDPDSYNPTGISYRLSARMVMNNFVKVNEMQAFFREESHPIQLEI